MPSSLRSAANLAASPAREFLPEPLASLFLASRWRRPAAEAAAGSGLRMALSKALSRGGFHLRRNATPEQVYIGAACALRAIHHKRRPVAFPEYL
jgi:hypothetical protein